MNEPPSHTFFVAMGRFERYKFTSKDQHTEVPSNTGLDVATIDPRRRLKMTPEEEVLRRYVVLSYKHDLRFSRNGSLHG